MSVPLGRLVALFRPRGAGLLLAALLAFATVGFGIGLMSAAGWLLARAAGRPGVAALQVAIVGVRFFGIGRGVLRYLERLVSHAAALRTLAELRAGVFGIVAAAAPALSADRRSGDLLARLVDDVETLDRLPVRLLIPAAGALLTACLLGLLLAAIGFGPVAAVLAAFLCAGVLAPVVAWKAGEAAGRRAVELRGDLQSALVDGVRGISDILAFGGAARHRARISSLGRHLAGVQVRSGSASALGSALAGLSADLAVVAVLALGLPRALAGTVGAVELAALTLGTIAAFEAVLSLSAGALEVGSVGAAAHRVFELADTPPMVESARVPVPVPPDPIIETQGLSYSYPGSPRRAVADVSFRVAPGAPVAIVGASGSGKSTVVSILARQLEVAPGVLRLSGVDVRDCDAAEVRSRLALVPQRTHLLTGTLRENLLLGRPGASEAEVIDAAERSGLHRLASRWPDGYDTWIGELGLRLSAGERQLVAITRAFLRDAPILVLDEPTANLDAVTEREVMTAIWRESSRRATLVVTHRVVRIEPAVEVIVMRDGEVVERGRVRDLRHAGGPFMRLLDLQLDSQAVECRSPAP